MKKRDHFYGYSRPSTCYDSHVHDSHRIIRSGRLRAVKLIDALVSGAVVLALIFGNYANIMPVATVYAADEPSNASVESPPVAPVTNTAEVAPSSDKPVVQTPDTQPTQAQQLPAPDQTPPASTEQTPSPTVTPPTSPTAPTSPTPPDTSNNFVLNPQTGLWESSYYIWDPATGRTTPKSTSNISYNPQTQMWDTTEWVYDPASKSYLPNPYTSANDIGIADQPQVSIGDSASQAEKLATPALIAPTDSSSASNIIGIFDNFFNASISGRINSQASSGGALINGNTLVGSVATGDAMGIANVLNILNSTWGLDQGQSVSTFLADIRGDVYGDILVNPDSIFAPSHIPIAQNSFDKVKINTQANGSIDNAINVGANTGNVDLVGNTGVGDTSTGNAAVMANVIDLMNTNIASGQSFIGTVNIYGNLDGDILLPKGFLDQSIGAPDSTPTAGCTVCADGSATLNTSVSQQIKNKIKAIAESGSVDALANTKIGDITTGSGKTNVSVYNLTGRQIVGENALMVFVNVLGF